jgi:hypothetical protein
MRVVKREFAECCKFSFDVHLQHFVPPCYNEDTAKPEDIVCLPTNDAEQCTIAIN